MISRIPFSALLLFLGFMLSQSVVAQQRQAIRPLGDMLNPDGTLNLESGFTGSIDPHGWRMEMTPDGTPRFMAERKGSSILSVPGDEYWDDRFGPPGTNGTIYAIAVRGTDVFVGGKFNAAGNVLANNIARWDAATRTWHEMGSGVGDAVYAIAVTPTELYIGGIFRTSEANGYVARWDAPNDMFVFLGNRGVVGLGDNTYNVPTATVYSLAVHGDSLFVGGWIQQVDNIPVSSLAVWNSRTSTWSALDNAGSVGYVRSLAVYGDKLYVGGTGIYGYDLTTKKVDTLGGRVQGTVLAMVRRGSNLFIGGDFTSAGGKPIRYLARFDGTSWTPLGGGVNAPVNALALHRGDLYAGGTFTGAGEAATNYVARWDGVSWSALDLGVGAENGAIIRTLASDSSNLYVGGLFTSAGTVTAHNIAGWDGKNWFPLIHDFDPGLNRNGTNGQVFAIAVAGNNVYVGGDFTVAGGVKANGIARFDSKTGSWYPLGNGITGISPFVRAIAVRGNDVYVGGTFRQAGSVTTSGIAHWDGTTWSAVGSGIGSASPFVFALTFFGNDLIAGGAFTSAGGVPANRVAAWNGTAWSGLGTGVTSDSGYVYVTALAATDTVLYVGGNFTRAGGGRVNYLARWNGAIWSGLAEGVNAPVAALATGNNYLYVGGEFTQAGKITARYIARWDGVTWDSLGRGTTAPVRGLAVGPDGAVYAGGEFTSVDLVSASRIARWSDEVWDYISIETGNSVKGANGTVRAVAVDNDGGIYIGGEFSIVGPRRANNVAYFDGRSWSSLGSDPSVGIFGPVLALAVDGDQVYVGGLFSAAGGMSAGFIARWDGQTWRRMGKGLNGPVRSILVAPTGEIYVGGEFTQAGDDNASGIAMWDGSDWHALGSGLGGAKPYAFSLAMGGDWLYVGGSFASAGGIASSRIARWNVRSQTWEGVGSGVHGAAFATYVASIAVSGTDLYIGGTFTNVGGAETNNVAHWDGGKWNSLAGGVNNAVYAVATGPGGEVYAAGDMTASEDTLVQRIVRWDGTMWQQLGAGMTGIIRSLVVSPNGVLFAGGEFIGSGAVNTNHIGMWNGNAWQQLGRGVDNDYSQGRVLAMAVTGNDLWVGGEFTVAGGRPSFYIGRWNGAYLSVEQSLFDISKVIPFTVAPNPAVSTVQLRFTLTQHSPVRLTVNDLLGREVAVVLEGSAYAGEHTLTFDTYGLPTGIYYCRLQSDDGTVTTRLVVSR